MVNSTCRSGKGNEEEFESEAAISREKQLVPFSLYPCLFCHHNAVNSDSGLVEIIRMPYSLPLAPSDPFLTPAVEIALIEGVYVSLIDIKKYITTKLRIIIQYTSSDCFMQLLERWKVTLKENKSIVLSFHVFPYISSTGLQTGRS